MRKKGIAELERRLDEFAREVQPLLEQIKEFRSDAALDALEAILCSLELQRDLLSLVKRQGGRLDKLEAELLDQHRAGVILGHIVYCYIPPSKMN